MTLTLRSKRRLSKDRKESLAVIQSKVTKMNRIKPLSKNRRKFKRMKALGIEATVRHHLAKT